MFAIRTYRKLALLLCLAAPAASGCFSPPKKDGDQTKGFGKFEGDLPRELDMVTMPEYTIEPPDVLRIDALRLVPSSPYKVEPLDGLFVQVANLPTSEPINGLFFVDPHGTITLGPSYGPPLKVIDMSLEQVKAAVEDHLTKVTNLNPKATVALGRSRAVQQIRGEHPVRIDGTVSLGSYGCVRVVGMSPMQAKAAIEEHLNKYLQQPEVSVEVAAHNSKVYYVIYDGLDGQQVLLMPITGNDTVLKAIGQIDGMPALSNKPRLWIARPAPPQVGRELILPVDWIGITTKGQTKTNYQLLPGDRLYVSDNRAMGPLEVLLGFSLSGN